MSVREGKAGMAEVGGGGVSLGGGSVGDDRTGVFVGDEVERFVVVGSWAIDVAVEAEIGVSSTGTMVGNDGFFGLRLS